MKAHTNGAHKQANKKACHPALVPGLLNRIRASSLVPNQVFDMLAASVPVDGVVHVVHEAQSYSIAQCFAVLLAAGDKPEQFARVHQGFACTTSLGVLFTA